MLYDNFVNFEIKVTKNPYLVVALIDVAHVQVTQLIQVHNATGAKQAWFGGDHEVRMHPQARG